jgi:hypothetical protein
METRKSEKAVNLSVDAIMAERFSGEKYPGATPRSEEYKAGVRAALEYHINDAVNFPPLPYPAGTPQADAWFAGTDEGHRLWRYGQEARR